MTSRQQMIEELKKSRSTNKSMVAITRKASPDTSKKNLDDYEVEKTIGKGSYAIVKLAKCKVSGDSFAIKTYERSSLNDPLKKQSVEREISLLRKLNNEFIIKYINHVVTQSQIHLVMEFAGTRSLYEYVKKGPNRHLSVDDSLSPFIQLAKAIAYIHSKDICHRDLKLENVIYNQKGEVKLIDFGFAVQSKEKLRTFCGTPTYMAPEIVKKKEYKGSKVDIWALGVLLYRMVTGTYPFKAKQDKELYRFIACGEYDESIITDQKVRDLVKKMLTVDPLKRISILGVLQHDWLAQKDFCLPIQVSDQI